MKLVILLVCGLGVMAMALPPKAKEIRVLAWSERTEPADVYPEGINGAIADMLKGDKNVKVTVANLADPDQGLSEEAVKNTDVLVWFGHRKHREVTDASIERVVRHVSERGMGFLPLHSAHYCKPFQALMRMRAEQVGFKLDDRQPPGAWASVKNSGAPQTLRVLDPKHPTMKGIKDFVIPKDEVYNNPFNVPPPDVKVLEGVWENGEQHGSDGMIWKVGKGHIFYFRAGHETYPIYFQAEVRQVLKNVIHWLGNTRS